MAGFANSSLGIAFQIEAQSGGKTDYPEHANGIFCIAIDWFPDDSDQLCADVISTVQQIDELMGGGVVIQRIDGQITPKSVFFKGAVYVVAQKSPRLGCLSSFSAILVLPIGGDDLGGLRQPSCVKGEPEDINLGKALGCIRYWPRLEISRFTECSREPN